ncbi:MAG: hypothetical protein M1819_004133 [Sarea resinae]|nr:MAG: hypothetical protein M1819_004133 [Sarea resinae]
MFSTNLGEFGPRSLRLPLPVMIVHSDAEAGQTKLVSALRSKYPSQCKAIRPQFHLWTYYDDYDVHLMGAAFLCAVLQRIGIENVTREEQVHKFVDSWWTTHLDQSVNIDANVKNTFTLQEIEGHDEDFLNDALAVLKAFKGPNDVTLPQCGVSNQAPLPIQCLPPGSSPKLYDKETQRWPIYTSGMWDQPRSYVSTPVGRMQNVQSNQTRPSFNRNHSARGVVSKNDMKGRTDVFHLNQANKSANSTVHTEVVDPNHEVSSGPAVNCLVVNDNENNPPAEARIAKTTLQASAPEFHLSGPSEYLQPAGWPTAFYDQYPPYLADAQVLDSQVKNATFSEDVSCSPRSPWRGLYDVSQHENLAAAMYPNMMSRPYPQDETIQIEQPGLPFPFSPQDAQFAYFQQPYSNSCWPQSSPGIVPYPAPIEYQGPVQGFENINQHQIAQQYPGLETSQSPEFSRLYDSDIHAPVDQNLSYQSPRGEGQPFQMAPHDIGTTDSTQMRSRIGSWSASQNATSSETLDSRSNRMSTATNQRRSMSGPFQDHLTSPVAITGFQNTGNLGIRHPQSSGYATTKAHGSRYLQSGSNQKKRSDALGRYTLSQDEVYIGDIPMYISESDLMEMLAPLGEIVGFSTRPNVGKWNAWVKFQDKAGAGRAVTSLGRCVLRGHELRVQYRRLRLPQHENPQLSEQSHEHSHEHQLSTNEENLIPARVIPPNDHLGDGRLGYVKPPTGSRTSIPSDNGSTIPSPKHSLRQLHHPQETGATQLHPENMIAIERTASGASLGQSSHRSHLLPEDDPKGAQLGRQISRGPGDPNIFFGDDGQYHNRLNGAIVRRFRDTAGTNYSPQDARSGVKARRNDRLGDGGYDSVPNTLVDKGQDKKRYKNIAPADMFPDNYSISPHNAQFGLTQIRGNPEPQLVPANPNFHLPAAYQQAQPNTMSWQIMGSEFAQPESSGVFTPSAKPGLYLQAHDASAIQVHNHYMTQFVLDRKLIANLSSQYLSRPAYELNEGAPTDMQGAPRKPSPKKRSGRAGKKHELERQSEKSVLKGKQELLTVQNSSRSASGSNSPERKTQESEPKASVQHQDTRGRKTRKSSPSNDGTAMHTIKVPPAVEYRPHSGQGHSSSIGFSLKDDVTRNFNDFPVTSMPKRSSSSGNTGSESKDQADGMQPIKFEKQPVVPSARTVVSRARGGRPPNTTHYPSGQQKAQSFPPDINSSSAFPALGNPASVVQSVSPPKGSDRAARRLGKKFKVQGSSRDVQQKQDIGTAAPLGNITNARDAPVMTSNNMSMRPRAGTHEQHGGLWEKPSEQTEQSTTGKKVQPTMWSKVAAQPGLQGASAKSSDVTPIDINTKAGVEEGPISSTEHKITPAAKGQELGAASKIEKDSEGVNHNDAAVESVGAVPEAKDRQ